MRHKKIQSKRKLTRIIELCPNCDGEMIKRQNSKICKRCGRLEIQGKIDAIFKTGSGGGLN